MDFFRPRNNPNYEQNNNTSTKNEKSDVMKAGPQTPLPEINLSPPMKQSSQPIIINHVSNRAMLTRFHWICNQLCTNYKSPHLIFRSIWSSIIMLESHSLTLVPLLVPEMAAEMALVKPISKFSTTITTKPRFNYPKATCTSRSPRFCTIKMSATSEQAAAATAQKPSKKSNKTAIKETLLTPRFYTTDFDEMETLFNTEINKKLNQAEFEALLQEFKTDYNQTHFVRNKEFKEAADKMQGPLRQIFVEFLERSCTAEFSGFLLYKELGRRLKVCLFNCFVIFCFMGHF